MADNPEAPQIRLPAQQRQAMKHASKAPSPATVAAAPSLRLDKWLWAARFYKTRSLATEDIDKGRVQVNEQVAKPSRELRVGDVLHLRQRGG